MNYAKKTIIFLSAFFLFLFSQNALAAEGDIIWAQTSNPTTGTDIANKVVSDSSGVYIVGYEGYASPSGIKMRIEKRSYVDGSIIWVQSFNPRNQGRAEIEDVAIDQNALYIAGYNYVCCFNTDYEWRVEKRSLIDGNLVWSVGNNFSAGDFRWDMALGIAVDSTGVYAVGREQAGATVLWRNEKRSLADGSLIWSNSQNTGWNWAYDVAVDSSGMYAIGPLFIGGKTQWYIIKLSLIDGNNVLWTQVTNFNTTSNYSQAISVNSSGVYVVGIVIGNNPYWSAIKIDQNNGGLIWSQIEDSATSGYPYDVDISNTNNIYIVGYNRAVFPDSSWRMEKRNVNGILQSPWPKELNPSTNNDVAYGVSLISSGDGVYVVGYASTPSTSDTSWRIEKRELAGAVAGCTGPVSISWADPSIVAGTTKIRAAHINELRANADLRRQDAGLANYVWTDSTLSAGTSIRAVHIQELRNAISEVYATCGQTTPVFSDTTLTSGVTKIRKVHIDELRSAISSAP